MPGLLGSSRARGAEVAELAKKLMHTDDQRVVELAVHGEFAAARVAAAASAEERLAQPSPREDVIALVHGEILHCDAPNRDPAQSAAFLREAYLRDPSCAFLSRATGVFGAVILDAPRRRILLVSDPLGFGHVYYSVGPRRELLFATEQKCFTGFHGGWEVQASAVEEFLRQGSLCGASTWLKGVELLPPGHYALYDLASQRLSTVQYCEPARAAGASFGSYEEAVHELTDAYTRAFERTTFDATSWTIQLDGGFSSRMLLASSEAAGHEVTALTAGDDESEDLLYARRACGVRNTIQFSARVCGENWLLKRAHLAWMAEGANLLRLSLAPLTSILPGRRTLSGFLGEHLLGLSGIHGYDDLRRQRLLSNARRTFGTVIRTWDNFCLQRFPFADPVLVAHAMRAEIAYLLEDRLRADIALRGFHDFFARIPVRGAGGRNVRQILSGAPPRKKRILSSYEELQERLRTDPKLESFTWELLAGPDALYRGFTDQKEAYAAFWRFFKGSAQDDREPLVRYLSLEIWLRQLLRLEFVATAPVEEPRSAPRVESVREPRPEVSVIVPAYNVGSYLGECLNSLINQDLRSLEVLAIDDGSTDDTPKILERFAAADSRIRVMRTPNSGVYHARNRALEVARGRFISFVDSDDYLHGSMLRTLVDVADRHGAEVTFCDVYQFDADGELRVRGNTLGFKPDAPLNLTNTPEMISDGFTTLWNRVYSRAFISQHALKFDERFRISADMLFLQEVLSRATAIVRAPKPLYFYRFATPNSLTSYEVRNAQYKTHLQITLELMDFWVRNKLFDRYASFVVTKAMRNFLWNTHIDAEKLEEVFRELHGYVRKLRVSPVQLARVAPFERRTFQLLRAGDYSAFARFVRPYRIKMVKAKGGELTRFERLAHGAGLLKESIERRFDMQLEKDAARKRYRVAWPNAKLDVAINYGVGAATDVAANASAVQRAVASLRAVRDGVLLEAELKASLAASKRGARHRVLHFSSAFSLPSETFTYDVITGLERREWLDNHVMFFTRELPRERPFGKAIQLHGCSRSELEAGEPLVAERIERVLEVLRPDLVHCHFGWVGIPLVLSLLKRGDTRPVVITMHGTDVNMWPARHAWYRDALKEIHQHPWVSFTTHTETYRTKLLELGIPATQIEVISNSFDPKFAAGRPRMVYEPGSHFRVISVARMDIWKGQEYLVQGFAEFVRTQHANSSLSLVGYGPQERALRALVEQLGLRDQVRFYGRVSHREIPVLLRNHDVYVQPSIRHTETLQEEGQPIAVLEAIGSGMPVIVTDTGAMAETVRVGPYAGNAFVIPDRSAAAIAEALGTVMRIPRGDDTGREYVRAISEKHSQARQIELTLGVYERAWADRGERRGTG